MAVHVCRDARALLCQPAFHLTAAALVAVPEVHCTDVDHDQRGEPGPTSERGVGDEELVRHGCCRGLEGGRERADQSERGSGIDHRQEDQEVPDEAGNGNEPGVLREVGKRLNADHAEHETLRVPEATVAKRGMREIGEERAQRRRRGLALRRAGSAGPRLLIDVEGRGLVEMDGSAFVELDGSAFVEVPDHERRVGDEREHRFGLALEAVRSSHFGHLLPRRRGGEAQGGRILARSLSSALSRIDLSAAPWADDHEADAEGPTVPGSELTSSVVHRLS